VEDCKINDRKKQKKIKVRLSRGTLMPTYDDGSIELAIIQAYFSIYAPRIVVHCPL
jgi:hypothetical protein